MIDLKNVIRLNKETIKDLELYREKLYRRYPDSKRMIELLSINQLIYMALQDAHLYNIDY